MNTRKSHAMSPRRTSSARRFPRVRLVAALLALTSPALVVATGSVGCETFVAPPEVTIRGAKDGVLTDTKAPLVLEFSKSIRKDTLNIKVVPLETDLEGNLLDEQGNPEAELKPLFSYTQNPSEASGVEVLGGTAELLGDDAGLVVRPTAPFPVGQKLALLIEPGLTSRAEGRATTTRRRILFSYDFRCSAARPTKVMQSGIYFALLDIQEPVPVQIQLWGDLIVDPATGVVRAQFTNADRKPAQKCPQACSAETVCRLLPAPDCVPPSLKAGTVDEYPDFIPNFTRPTGYTVTITGCAEDQDENTAAFVSAPANLVVEKPEVQVNGLILTAAFKKEPNGTVRSTGTVTGSEIVFGSQRLSSGRGTATIRTVPADEAPKDIPPAPPASAVPTRDN
ncbi:MAG TPA: hypothetical protein PLR99_11180 [Polyangiaceae bacterium]|nr:hypothetical protein [Polyangiaceae bacterium]